MAGTLREFDVALYDGAEDQFLEVALHLVVDLAGQAQAAVIHREQETLDLELRVEFALDDLDGVEQLADALQGEILTLHGDDDAVGCRQRIDRDQTERGLQSMRM